MFAVVSINYDYDDSCYYRTDSFSDIEAVLVSKEDAIKKRNELNAEAIRNEPYLLEYDTDFFYDTKNMSLNTHPVLLSVLGFKQNLSDVEEVNNLIRSGGLKNITDEEAVNISDELNISFYTIKEIK